MHFTLQELANKYPQYCQVIRSYKPDTINSYKSVFNVFLCESGIKTPYELNLKVLEAFFFHGRIERKWGTVTYRSYIKNLNTFMKWLIKEEHIPENYLEKIEKPRQEQRIPRILSQRQTFQLLEY